MKKATKVPLSRLKPNPFRKYICDGKTDPEEVESLIRSLNQKGEFWLGLLARPIGPDGNAFSYPDDLKDVPKGVNFQICFGHNRLEALRKWKNDPEYLIRIEFDTFSDKEMIQKLAEENKGRASNAYERRARWDFVQAVFKWLKKHREECDRFGSTAKRHEGECTADCISELLGGKGYPRRTVSELLSLPRPPWPEPEGQTESTLQKDAPVRTSVSSTQLSEPRGTGSMLDPGEPTKPAEGATMLTLAEQVRKAIEEDAAELERIEIARKKAEAARREGEKGKPSTPKPPEVNGGGATAICKSLDTTKTTYTTRLEKLILTSNRERESVGQKLSEIARFFEQEARKI